MLKGRDGRITTDIYHKPTYSFNYITFDSGHPRHTKVNIPFNMERRIRTIVSDEERSKQKLEDLKAILESKIYPKKLVEDGIRRAKNIPQEELRKTKPPEENNNIDIACVTTYNPNNPNVLSTVKNTLPLLKQSPQMNKIVDKIKIINSKRQPPYLKRILTRARFQLEEHIQTTKVIKCNQSLCGTCKHLKEGNNIVLQFYYQTTHVVYCQKCHILLYMPRMQGTVYCVNMQSKSMCASAQKSHKFTSLQNNGSK